MKFKIALSALFLLWGASFSSLRSEEMKGSQVVLDWDKFVKLWEEATKPAKSPEPETPPPVDYILSSAQYECAVQPGASVARAAFKLNVLQDKKWVRIPFLPASLGLKEATLDGKTVPVAQEGGYHSLVLKGAGSHSLTAVFSLSTPAKDGTPSFSFSIVPTAMTLVSFVFNKPNLDVSIPAAQVISSKTEGGKTRIEATLPPSSYVQVSWQKELAPEAQLPAKLYSKLEQLLTVGESAISIRSQFTYSILHSGVDEIRIKIPENVTVLNAAGGDVQDWKILQAKTGNILSVQLNRKVKGTEMITVTSEFSYKNEPATAAPILRSAGVEREEGSIAIEAKSNVEIALKETKGLRKVDVKELPQGLWASAGNPLLYGFTISDPAASLSVGIERHEGIPVLTSTVDGANAVTVLTKDGQWVTRVSFQVRNHLKQFIHMKLPEGAEIWSAFVSNQAVKPSKDKDGQILIPLEKSILGYENASFPVEVIYFNKGKELGVGGNRSVFLPTVDLPVSEMLWSLYVPEDFNFVNFSGNMEKEKWARGIYPALAQNGEAVSRQSFGADVGSKVMTLAGAIRQRMETNSLAGAPESVAYSDEMMKNQAVMELKTFDKEKDNSSMQNQVLPISFRIPEAGRLYRFGKIMVIETVPQVGLTYVRSEIVTVLRFLFLGLVLGSLYRMRSSLLEGLRAAVKKMGKLPLKNPLAKAKESEATA